MKREEVQSGHLLAELRASLAFETTEKQRLLKELRTSQEGFRAKFNGSPVPVFCWRPLGDDFVLVDYNRAALELYRQTIVQLLGKTASDVYPDRPDFIDDLRKCYAEKSTIRREHNHRMRLTGEIRQFDTTVVFAPPDLVMVHVQDITQRNQINQALQASQERFRAQFKGTTVPIFCWQHTGEDFVLVDYNDAAVKISRGMITTLFGKKASEVYRERPMVLEYLNRSFEEKSTVRRVGEFQMLSTGEVKFFDASFVFVPPDLVMIHTEDITDRKHAEDALRAAEQKYRDIFEHANDGIFQTTPDGHFLTANPALARMLGYDSPAQLIAERTDLASQHYVDRGKRSEFKQLMDDEGVVMGFEYEAYRRDGSRIWMSASIRSVKDEKGELLYYEGTAADITERKNAEEALRVSGEALRRFSRKLIEAQETERQRIAHELHDEIGQVLTAVRINLHKALQLSQSDQARSHIGESIGIVDEALRQVHDLSLDLRPSLLDDLGLVSALRWYFKRFAHRTGIKVKVRTHGFKTTDRFARELETTSFRIAQEALTNVARHAHAKHASVQLRKRKREFFLSVKDDGVGIDLEALKKHKSGAGKLGLRGMEERAMALSGWLEISSAPTMGTEIRARFPLDSDVAQEAPQTMTAKTGS